MIAITTRYREQPIIGDIISRKPDRTTGSTSTITSTPAIGIIRVVCVGNISTVCKNFHTRTDHDRSITIGHKFKGTTTGTTSTGTTLTLLAIIPPTTGTTTAGSTDQGGKFPVTISLTGHFITIIGSNRCLTCIGSTTTGSF